MLTGHPPFTGPTVAETLADIIGREPDWRGLPPGTPGPIRELLRRCLQKDLAHRLSTIAEARNTIGQVQRGWNWWRAAAIGATVVALLTLGAALLRQEPGRLVDQSEWVQLTNFSDSVTHPALSPDGRMVAFVRGASNSIVPFVRGQIYVKVLPDGDPVQLTNDNTFKMTPVFSPDGSRIAYTSVNAKFEWDTWTVPVHGGDPKPWLLNASGLAWAGRGRVLFSEMKNNPHMGIVAAAESRIGQRDVYVPAHAQGMAHLSYASPDGKSVLLVEMDRHHAWTPCRVVPIDGSSAGRLVGPPGAGCTFGAWSPDGKWIYLTSNAGRANHIWRQRFPDGAPEQITSGPTEEEGVAIAPDGRSFVTAVALRSASLWLHTPEGERQVSLEGNAIDAKFTADGTKLLFKVVDHLGDYPLPGQLRIADVKSGQSEILVPGVEVFDYDIAHDGKEVVLEARDRDGHSRLWLVPLDRRSPPRQIPDVDGRQPRFSPTGEIFFGRAEGAATFVYRVRPDGTGVQKAIEPPIPLVGDVSPDGRWITGWTSLPGNEASAWQAFPIDGGMPRLLGSSIDWRWSPGGDSVWISGHPVAEGRSYAIALTANQMFPPIPENGFHAEPEIARLPGARRVDGVVVPGPSSDVYAVYRRTTQRNVYSIPIR